MNKNDSYFYRCLRFGRKTNRGQNKVSVAASYRINVCGSKERQDHRQRENRKGFMDLSPIIKMKTKHILLIYLQLGHCKYIVPKA